MNWYSQLTRLILSFYREDPAPLEQLKPIRSCKVSRRWGILKVECRDIQTARTLANAIELLREPVAQLRLAHHIHILVRGSLLTTLPVDSSKLKA